MELNKKQKGLLAMLYAVPPDYEVIEEQLQQGCYTPEDVSRVGAVFVDDCGFEFGREDANPTGTHSEHLYQIVSLLLRYGLDPNAVYEDGTCILSDLMFVKKDYVAADTLRLLLENGGDIHLEMDGGDVFSKVDFDVVFNSVN